MTLQETVEKLLKLKELQKKQELFDFEIKEMKK